MTYPRPQILVDSRGGWFIFIVIFFRRFAHSPLVQNLQLFKALHGFSSLLSVAQHGQEMGHKMPEIVLNEFEALFENW